MNKIFYVVASILLASKIIFCMDKTMKKQVVRDVAKHSSSSSAAAAAAGSTQAVEEAMNLVKKQESTKKISLPWAAFSPGIDDVLLTLINKENASIHCACYLFTLPEIAQAWAKRKTEKKLEGHLVIDGECEENNSALKVLREAKISMSFIGGYHRYGKSMHHKFFLFGNIGGKQMLVTGSPNVSWSGVSYHWENIIVTTNSAIIKRFTEEWTRLMIAADEVSESIQGSSKLSVELENNEVTISLPGAYFSPNIDNVLKNLILQENKGIYMAGYLFTLKSLAKAWIKRKKKVVKFISKVCVDQSFGQYSITALRCLYDNEVDIIIPKRRNDRGKMHHKFFIFLDNIDTRTILVTGSYNPTPEANKHWENVVIYNNVALIEQFFKEWESLCQDSEKLTNEDFVCVNKSKSKSNSFLDVEFLEDNSDG